MTPPSAGSDEPDEEGGPTQGHHVTYYELMDMRVAELRDLADRLDLDSTDMRKAELRGALMEELGLSDEVASEDETPF